MTMTKYLVAGMVAALGLAGLASADTVLVNIPLNQQINIGNGDAIYVPAGLNGSLSFLPASPPGEPDGWVRNNFLAGWYYGPYVSFQRAGYGDLNCANAKLEVDLRYYKVSGNYADAPVFVRIYTADSAGNYVGYRDYSIVYAVQPPWNNPPYPTWTHVTVWLNNPALNPYTEGGTFSIGTVSYMRFYGTDWSGQEGDFIDAKKLVITDVPPQVNANAGPDQTFPTAACSTQVTLDGSGSTGPIVRYVWKRASVTLADVTTPTTTIGLASGTHTLTLFVYDAANNVDSDDMIVTIPPFPPTGLPVDLPMDQQLNHAITGGPIDQTGGPIAFLTDGGEAFTRRYFTTRDNGMDWYYYGPYVNFIESCNGPVDITAPNTFLQFRARLYKVGGYDDAPIFVRLRDTGGRLASFGLLYQTAPWFPEPATPYPAWTRITTDMTFESVAPDFDYANVVQVEFWGTDWGGTGADYVDIQDLFLGVLTPPTANAGPDQTFPGSGCAPSASVTLNGSGSLPGTAPIVRYVWTYNGTVLYDGPNPTKVTTLSGAGAHYVFLKVYDDRGLYSSDIVKITIGTALPLPIDVPMDVQIDNGLGNAIYTPASTDPLDPDGEVVEVYVGEDIYGAPTDYTTGYMLLGGDWYHGPWFRLIQGCYGTVDLSGANMHLKFDGRYFQDASNWACDPADPNCSPKPYQDAPIMVTLRDVAGKRGCLGICYGANFYDPTINGQPNPLYDHQYPEWLTVDVNIQDYLATHPGVGANLSDPGFDLSKVIRIEFHGTDWGGTGWDEINIKNLWVGPVAPDYCLGDLDCNGQVSFGDINPFVLYLSNYAVWQTTYAGCNPKNGDINNDGVYPGFGDINPFVTLLSTSSLPIMCP